MTLINSRVAQTRYSLSVCRFVSFLERFRRRRPPAGGRLFTSERVGLLLLVLNSTLTILEEFGSGAPFSGFDAPVAHPKCNLRLDSWTYERWNEWRRC
jgi:hypothetical protein